jgi:hypothetical protein
MDAPCALDITMSSLLQAAPWLRLAPRCMQAGRTTGRPWPGFAWRAVRSPVLCNKDDIHNIHARGGSAMTSCSPRSPGTSCRCHPGPTQLSYTDKAVAFLVYLAGILLMRPRRGSWRSAWSSSATSMASSRWSSAKSQRALPFLNSNQLSYTDMSASNMGRLATNAVGQSQVRAISGVIVSGTQTGIQ